MIAKYGMPLSPRELEIIKLVSQGKQNKEIATELVIEEGTVKDHIRNIFIKLGAKNRSHAVFLMRDKLIRGGYHEKDNTLEA